MQSQAGSQFKLLFKYDPGSAIGIKPNCWPYIQGQQIPQSSNASGIFAARPFPEKICTKEEGCKPVCMIFHCYQSFPVLFINLLPADLPGSLKREPVAGQSQCPFGHIAHHICLTEKTVRVLYRVETVPRQRQWQKQNPGNEPSAPGRISNDSENGNEKTSLQPHCRRIQLR